MGGFDMPRVSLAFFLVGAVFGLTGMIWGTYMGVSQEFSTRDAHAHLNLLGWATLSLMGTFYALSGPARPKLLSWINFFLSVIGVILFVPFLVVVSRGEPSPPIFAMGLIGVLMVMLGMATFIAAIVMAFLRKPVTA